MMNVYTCESAAEIVAHINSQGIPRESIQAILCDSSGLYSILWWI